MDYSFVWGVVLFLFLFKGIEEKQDMGIETPILTNLEYICILLNSI